MKTDGCRSALEDLAPGLLEAYNEWKAWEKAKNEDKQRFFELADKAVEIDRGLAVKLVEITAHSEQVARERAERHNPGWLIEESRYRPAPRNFYEVILRENPALQPYSFEYEGWKIARQVRKGAVMVDDQWLMEEDIDLFLECCFELPWGQVVIKPIEHLDAETISRLAKYIYNDAPRVSLAAPRQIKDEE